MKRSLLIAALFCLPFSVASQPVNPHATPEARALLAYIASISGKGIVTGQHNYPNDVSRWTDRTLDLTGKYPGLFGQDFGFSAGEDKDSVLSRPAMIEEVERQWARGSVITLTWHEVRPTDDEPVTFHDSVQGHLTDYEWRELLTPGTPLYNRWCDQVDVIAGYLRALGDAHVPVLFRPYHEMNGNWFWWGGRPGPNGSAALYRQLYDRYVNKFHLDNLVWVWNVNAPGGNAGPVADYFPGAQFADLATIDIYGEFKQDYYDSMLALAAGKPIALAEVGDVPSLEVLAKQPRWAYFMVWSGFLDPHRLELTTALYNSPLAITRNDPRQSAPLAAIRNATTNIASTEPVTPNADSGAKDLVTLLAEQRGKSVLTGAPYGDLPMDPARGNSGPYAAIVSVDVGLEGIAGKSVLKDPASLHAHHQVVFLTWSPARPSDNGSPRSTLTDFEWNELLTPGSDLNKLWAAQADEVAGALRTLQDANVAVMFNPYHETNAKDDWWDTRKGIHGSPALYRMLFDRLVNRDGLRNLVWVWEAEPPIAGSASLSDYFPGLLYVDALELSPRFMRRPDLALDRFLTALAPGKPVGIELSGDIPTPDALFARSQWSWFILDAAPDTPARTDALQKLLTDPRISSVP